MRTLEAWIIDDLLRQEREGRERERPALRLPIGPPPGWIPPPPSDDIEEAPERGVIIIDLNGGETIRL